MCFEISEKIEQEMRSTILIKVRKRKFVFMLGRTMFDIIWVNFAKNQEEKPGKSLPRILASHWRKHRQNKKILFPRKHSFEL